MKICHRERNELGGQTGGDKQGRVEDENRTWVCGLCDFAQVGRFLGNDQELLCRNIENNKEYFERVYSVSRFIEGVHQMHGGD